MARKASRKKLPTAPTTIRISSWEERVRAAADVVEAIGDADVGEIVRLLLEEEDHVVGSKDLLLAAFTTWICMPNDDQMVRDAAVIRLSQKLAHFEENALKARHTEISATVIAEVRSSPKNRLLAGDMYVGLGGTRALIESYSVSEFRRQRRAQLRQAEDVALLIGLIHFDQARQPLTSGARRRPSREKAIEAYFEIGRDSKGWRRLGDRSLKARWAEFRPSLAFVYAGLSLATPIRISRGQLGPWQIGESDTPLKTLCAGTRTFNAKQEMFRRLVSRARYAQEVILAQCPAADQSKFRFPNSVSPEEIPPPEIDPELATSIVALWEQKKS